MKKIFILILITTELSFSQLHLPELSPEGKIMQPVGYTTFTVTYGRPAARQRKIMGGLVAYNKLWRTGAGKCTTLSFDHDVTIANQIIPAGIYALLSVPNEKEWTIILNRDVTKVYGDPSEYDPKQEVVRFTVTPQKTNRFYESLTCNLDIIRNDVVFYLAWENTEIHFPIATGIHQKSLADIALALEKNPTDQSLLSEASQYYSMSNEDPQQVLKWLNVALEKGTGGDNDVIHWVHQQKIDMLARMQDYTAARKAISDAISFLNRVKPREWQERIQHFETQMRGWRK